MGWLGAIRGEVREQVVGEVRAVLAEVDAEIAARRPVCRASGRCCRFEEYGHRLYVTHAEVVYFAAMQRQEEGGAKEAGAGRGVSLPQFFGGAKPEGCPYQVEGLCTAREGRPLGCRVYFCDAGAQGWQNEVYEKYHSKIKAIHERYGLAYGYVEWRAGLRMIAAQGTGMAQEGASHEKVAGDGRVAAGGSGSGGGTDTAGNPTRDPGSDNPRQADAGGRGPDCDHG